MQATYKNSLNYKTSFRKDVLEFTLMKGLWLSAHRWSGRTAAWPPLWEAVMHFSQPMVWLCRKAARHGCIMSGRYSCQPADLIVCIASHCVRRASTLGPRGMYVKTVCYRICRNTNSPNRARRIFFLLRIDVVTASLWSTNMNVL